MEEKKFDLGDYLKKKWKNIIRMLLAVCIMGVGVAVLNLTPFGPDPCSALHYGMAEVTGLSFGTYQAIINIILLVVVLLLDRSLFGLGTLGNMFLVGYSADFTNWLIGKIFGEVKLESLGSQVAVMIPALIIFVFAAATYMTSELGTSPYDALSFFIHKFLCNKTKKNIPFKLVRIVYDGVVTVAAVVVCFLKQMDSTVGIVTVLMVFMLGPAVDFVAKLMKNNKNSAG